MVELIAVELTPAREPDWPVAVKLIESRHYLTA